MNKVVYFENVYMGGYDKGKLLKRLKNGWVLVEQNEHYQVVS